MPYSKWGPGLLVLGLLFLCALIAFFPEPSWEAAVRGLSIWWDVLFPSLFPFFVISEVLLGFGIVHFLGTLLDPLMKPLFRIPGSGGFVAAMGFAAGYPVSARLTAKLREQNLVSREEGERLVAFTTSSDPIFLIGAVSVGFFHSPDLAVTLALAHYGGSLLIGIVMRNHGKSSPPTLTPTSTINLAERRTKRLTRALRAMHSARIADGRDLGELLRQAVVSSLQLMTVVGGLVVFFSVFLALLTSSGLISLCYEALRNVLAVIGLPGALAEPIISGIFEVTLGAKNAAAIAVAPVFKAAAAAFVLSWGGLSVHAQVASILNQTDLRYTPFLTARFIHALVSATIVVLIWPYTGTEGASAVLSLITAEWNFYGSDSLERAISFGRSLGIILILSSLLLLIRQWIPTKPRAK